MADILAIDGVKAAGIDTSGLNAFRISIEDRIKELAAHNIEHILYEIYEKNSNGEWERKKVLIQAKNNDQQFSDAVNQKKVDQYRGYGKIVALSGNVLFAVGQAYCSAGGNQLLAALFAGGAKAFDALNSTFVDDRRAVQITLLDNQYQRVGSIVNERSSDVQRADYQKALELLDRTADRANNSAMRIFS